MPLFSLTLEEGATCPASCPMLQLRPKGKKWRCYGANMPYAKRYRHGELLEDALMKDLRFLHEKYTNGFIVRLHVLGDFYSVDYVRFWENLLREHWRTRVFGFSHVPAATPIGQEITQFVKLFSSRVSILRSTGADINDPLPKAVVIGKYDEVPQGFVTCPWQTHRVPCTKCGLCMSGQVNVAFREH